MAIYQYSCIECDKNLDITRGMTEDEIIPPCPSCGYKMARVYDAPGIQFKGKGFYKTDNK